MFKVDDGFSPAPLKFLRALPSAMFNVFGNVAPMPPTLKSGKATSELSSKPPSVSSLVLLLLFFAGDGDFIMSMFKLALRVVAASLLLLKRFIGNGFAELLTLPSPSSPSNIGDNNIDFSLFCFFFCVVVDVNGNLRLPSIESCVGERCCEGGFLLTSTLPLDFNCCCCCCEGCCFDGVDFFAVAMVIFCIGIAATFLLLPLVC
mmetsp:Transcript_7134/g.22189  ORF Transcript_7134/g.22189 Transcript_7134/m.22189 type:complete len:204 (+) Transcript_7134:223-834(+)